MHRTKQATAVLALVATSGLVGMADAARAESTPAENPEGGPVTVTAQRQVPMTTFASVSARATRTVVVHHHGRKARATRTASITVRLPAHAVGTAVASCTDESYELASDCANSSAQRAARSDALTQLADVVQRELPRVAKQRAAKAAATKARRAAMRRVRS